MKLANLFSAPGELEHKNMMAIAEILQLAANNHVQLVDSCKAMVEMIKRLQERVTVLENRLRQ